LTTAVLACGLLVTLYVFCLPLPRPPSSTLFPYTTLFRSHPRRTLEQDEDRHHRDRDRGDDDIQHALRHRHRGPREPEDLGRRARSEEHTSELQSLRHLVCRLLLEKKKNKKTQHTTQPPHP